VTKVDEWTRALTGVGAAIAAGSHLENGICALFVMAATIIKIICDEVRSICCLVTLIFIIYQCPWFSVSAIAIKSKASPTRFDRAVNMPAANDLAFW
jgi:hypothetical protein